MYLRGGFFMPRKVRIVIPNQPHHVTQRGNYQQTVFESEIDYQKYSYWIREYAVKYGVDIYAYCLMPNHVHFIVMPSREESLARLFNTVHMLYSQYKNKKNGRTGHLWQGRFYSCILGDDHLIRAIRYVEKNPIRAHIVKCPWQYVWSSAREHMGINKESIIYLKKIEDIMFVENWKMYLQEKDDEILEGIRVRTKRGSAFGSKEFLEELGVQFNRDFLNIRKGRPRKVE